ncbi:MAG: VOC family protein [Salinigranum sp.]
MQVRSIDHVNLRIPPDGLEEARTFYAEHLGFAIEGVERYERGDKPFFSVRLAPENIIHLQPTEGFEPPDGTNYDHVALVVEEGIDAVKERLDAADVDIDRELVPLGATGEAPAVYVTDPFGYVIELKSAVGE